MSSGIGVSYFGVLLLVLLLGAVAALVILLARRAFAKPPETAGGRCGKCGYAAVGLTTFTCPECGSDLRDVGIVPAASGKRSSSALLLVAAGAGLLVLLCCGGVFWARTPVTTQVRTPPAPAPAANPATPPPRPSTWQTERAAPPLAPNPDHVDVEQIPPRAP